MIIIYNNVDHEIRHILVVSHNKCFIFSDIKPIQISARNNQRKMVIKQENECHGNKWAIMCWLVQTGIL
ncbi:hypothetical protein BB987_02405 [Photorhabdus temperata]|uniref:Uncharacterized protein n=1 Tax=Photorhabdus stackebrandtii TaxID=1123042 RepID=A0A7X5QK19_9GAMM|nr:hypothetical protein [Photorhabdus stackebrandtii]OHV50221.1 hypothetical protein BB987_02405 [Photorhabdus temperata]